MSGTDWSTRKTDLEGRVPVLGNKFLPRFAGFSAPWAAHRGRLPPPGTPPPGTELGLLGHGCGLSPCPQMHREHGLPQPPKWAKPRVSLRWVSMQWQGRRLRRTQRKAKLPSPNLYPHVEILTLPPFLPAACAHPCSSSPRCWEWSSGSTEYMSFLSSLRLWPILNKGFSHLLKIKRKGEWHIFELWKL